ncbi:hypothetical protein [Bifidobacterium sp. ESL0732]|uniref:hypothetical protein n=1 Tax=Bifidobacterium sp. ESL0732 TaxID=2983222 RepID=UPI0023F7836C|nr:hypothetical protein [Bifidobacterium sp. ESL0732]WEV63324.1 hypothetical protein OZX70_04920 [Bifidobacterium sp. ESL0732]
MKNFFKGISVSQIVAGALAAVTSFLLSAKIGIAGSVIGVAVGSIVSAVASQIYQNVLRESGRKLQENAPQNDDAEQQDAVDAGSGDETRVIGSDVQHHGQSTNPIATQGEPVLRMDGTSTSLAALARTEKTEQASVDQGTTKVLAANDKDGKHASDKNAAENGKGKSDATQVLAPSASGKTSVMAPVGQKQPVKAPSGSAKALNGKKLKGGPGQSDGHIRVFDSSKQKRYKRLAIVVAVVSALVAVGITAGIISLATKGQGTDDVVRNIVTNSATKNRKQQNDSGDSSTDGNQKMDSGTQKNNGSTNQNNSGSTSDSGSQNGSTSNGSGSSSSNSTNGNSGSSNSGTTSGGTSSDSGSSGGSTGSSSGTSNGSGSTDSGSTSGSTSGDSGTSGSESGSTSGSQPGNGTSSGNSGASK